MRLTVARYEAPYDPANVDPSSYFATEERYQRERATAVHALVDQLDLTVDDLGDTDDPHPHETVRLIIDVSGIVVPTAATLFTAWLSARPAKKKARVPGFALDLPDGTRVVMTHADGFSDADREQRVRAVLDAALRSPEPGTP